MKSAACSYYGCCLNKLPLRGGGLSIGLSEPLFSMLAFFWVDGRIIRLDYGPTLLDLLNWA